MARRSKAGDQGQEQKEETPALGPSHHTDQHGHKKQEDQELGQEEETPVQVHHSTPWPQEARRPRARRRTPSPGPSHHTVHHGQKTQSDQGQEQEEETPVQVHLTTTDQHGQKKQGDQGQEEETRFLGPSQHTDHLGQKTQSDQGQGQEEETQL